MRHLFHLRTLGLCVAAVFAVAAFSASSAMAGKPEWGKCEAQVGGKYLDAGCTTKGKGGEFEWHKGTSLPNVKFTGHNVGSGGLLKTIAEQCEPAPEEVESRKECTEKGGKESEPLPIFVECESENSAGEASGKNLVLNVTVVFKGCKALGAIPCKSAGAAEEEVKVNPLEGELGIINAAEKSVGILLHPTTKGAPFATFECGGFLENVVGVGPKKQGPFYAPKGGNDGIIAPITPVNTETSTFTQTYTQNAKDENVPSHFEGKKTALLEVLISNITDEPPETGFWEPGGEEVTNEVENAEPGEIKVK